MHASLASWLAWPIVRVSFQHWILSIVCPQISHAIAAAALAMSDQTDIVLLNIHLFCNFRFFSRFFPCNHILHVII